MHKVNFTQIKTDKCYINNNLQKNEQQLLVKRFSFTYLERLHLQVDFNRVFKNGLKLENKDIKIFVYNRNDGVVLRRVGLVTSRNVGNAVVRNKTKRRLKEIFRLNKNYLKPSLDMIFVLKIETTFLKYNDLKKNIFDLLKKFGFYRDSKCQENT
ncbi:MAG: ribonuclease P protein component [Endomicrobium sp.]|nr:ribonuclease P protein component [Endomicrobium sp.]